jgi:hypothetical protein
MRALHRIISELKQENNFIRKHYNRMPKDLQEYWSREHQENKKQLQNFFTILNVKQSND